MAEIDIISIISKLLIAVLILALGILGTSYVERRLFRLVKGPASVTWQRYVRIARYTVYFIVFVVVLAIFTKVYPAVYIAYIVILIFIIAFFDLIRNWGIGFYFRVMEHIKVGDEIEVGNIEGTVIEINDYGLTLMTTNKELAYIPNVYLIHNPIKNRTTGYSTIFKARVMVPTEKDSISVLHEIHDSVMELRGEFVTDPTIYKEGEKEGYSVYVVEYELLNIKKNLRVLRKLEMILRNRIGDYVKIES